MGSVADAITKCLKVRLGEGRFDQREEFVLLEVDMLLESLAKFVQCLKGRSERESFGVATDQHVVEERRGDSGVIRVAVCGVGRQQQLLLDTEVQLLLCLPVLEEGPSGLGHGLWCRVP